MTEALNRVPKFSHRIITLMVIILFSIAILTTQSDIKEYDQIDIDEPLFKDNLQLEEHPGSQGGQEVELTADPRYSDFEPSWEMKFNGDSKNYSPKFMSSKQKRETQKPSMAARNLIGSTFKHAEVAINEEELTKKLEQEKKEQTHGRESKRNLIISEDLWSCQTKYEWRDLGPDHYPRHVRTAKCEAQRCANSLFHCHPRKYKIKILKRVTVSDSATFEEPDNSLPGALRADWRLISVDIIHCCDCSVRPPSSVTV